MDSILEKVERYIADNNMLSRGESVVAGVSGGADSMCLLFVLMALKERLGLDLCVVHINHGIRGASADKDQEFVENFCQNHGILWKSFRADIPALAAKEHLSEEEAGRQYRYRCFEETLQEITGRQENGAENEGAADAEGATGTESAAGANGPAGATCAAGANSAARRGRIAVAHNKNDVTETLLMNMFRGCGIRGLCGIPPVRDRIIRPLLCLERSEIEQLLSENGLEYRTDETNFENDYTRNRLRNELIPYIHENINAGAAEHVYQLTQMASDVYQYITRQQEKVYPRVCREDGSLDAEALKREDKVIIEEILRRKVSETVGKLKDITQIHIREIAALLNKPVGKRVCLPYGLTVVRRYESLEFNVEPNVEPVDAKLLNVGAAGQEATAGVKPDDGAERTPAAGQGVTAGVTPAAGLDLDIPNPLPRTPASTPAAVIPIPGTALRAECLLKFNEENQRIEQKQYTKWFDYAKIKNGLKIRHRQTGDYMIVDGRGSRKLIRRLMIDEKIPREERDNILLVADGSHILWMIGGRISDAYKVTPQTKEIIEIKIKGEE